MLACSQSRWRMLAEQMTHARKGNESSPAQVSLPAQMSSRTESNVASRECHSQPAGRLCDREIEAGCVCEGGRGDLARDMATWLNSSACFSTRTKRDFLKRMAHPSILPSCTYHASALARLSRQQTSPPYKCPSHLHTFQPMLQLHIFAHIGCTRVWNM